MRYIKALLTAFLLAACNTEPTADTAPLAPPPVLPDDSSVRLVAMDKDGNPVSKVVDGAAWNRIVKARWENMQRYHRGEEVVQQKLDYLGIAGPGCAYYGSGNCPLDPYELCSQNNATWLYNEPYGWNSYNDTLIVGCIAGDQGHAPQGPCASTSMLQLTFYNPYLGYSASWGNSMRSAWSGSERVAFVRSDDIQQCPVVPTVARQMSPWQLKDWGTVFNAQPAWLESMYHW